MSAITPNTNLKLLKLPLELDNKNQINFASKTAQYNYFNSLDKIEVDNFTYQRADSVIRYPAHIDSILNYNYVMYQNEEYSDKWFYAFITNMQYINDNMTAITIKTDSFQTWFFDLEFKDSFVEREHVDNDTIGLHTVPENLETGDFISCNLQPSFSTDLDTCFVLAVTELLTSSFSALNQLIPLGLYYIGLTSLVGVEDYIKQYDEAGKGEAVNSVFVIPKNFFTSWSTTEGITGQTSYSIRFDYSTNIEITKVNYLGNNYLPHNNKLLTFPYSFLQVSNHAGQIANYKWEDFNLLTSASTNKIEFSIKGALTPSGSFKAFPINYKNILNNYDDSINIGKYPIGAFKNDLYANWMAQNGINIGLSLVGSGLQMASGIALSVTEAGALSGGAQIASGLMGVANTLGSIYQHSLVPDTVNGNVNSGDVNFTLGLTNLEFKRMSIKNEYASIIDKFWDMYGYKVNIVKTPNFTSRTNWNYVKTIDCNIHAYAPQKDIEEIKQMFNNGITIWHTTNYFLDYSRSNNIA